MLKKVETAKKYMIVPVCREQKDREFKIRYDGETMNAYIPVCSPDQADFTASYPMPGKVKCIEAEEELFQNIIFSDYPAGRDQTLHQSYHLSAEQGWINDPNGLYFQDGVWHCFFQYNPFNSFWGNMHWNHAVSRDLIHWKELGIALYPDKDGFMFSGGAVIDSENVSGLGKNAVLLYYTQSGYSGACTQALAYSTDGGRTIQKYAENPLIPNRDGSQDRDPAPVYDPDEKVWYLPLYRADEQKDSFDLFVSTDLLHWRRTDNYRIPGGNECPGIRRMKDSADGQWKWVLTEAHCFYRIAEIHNGKVRCLTDSRKFICGDAYAGQFFCNAPEQKDIFLAWITMRMQECRFKTWNGCMSLPVEFTLCGNTLQLKPYAVPQRMGKTENPQIPFESVLKTGNSEKCSFRFGKQEFLFDLQTHKMTVGDKEYELPEEFTGGHLYADNASAEFFSDDGKFTLISYLSDGSDFSVQGFSAECYRLKV